MVARLQRHWRALTPESHHLQLVLQPDTPRWVAYTGDGVALEVGGNVWVAAQTADRLEQARRTLGVTWRDN